MAPSGGGGNRRNYRSHKDLRSPDFPNFLSHTLDIPPWPWYNTRMGMKEMIKRGEMTPKQALKTVSKDPHASSSFVAWCKRRISKKNR